MAYKGGLPKRQIQSIKNAALNTRLTMIKLQLEDMIACDGYKSIEIVVNGGEIDGYEIYNHITKTIEEIIFE